MFGLAMTVLLTSCGLVGGPRGDYERIELEIEALRSDMLEIASAAFGEADVIGEQSRRRCVSQRIVSQPDYV